jgi:hypothetical protein
MVLLEYRELLGKDLVKTNGFDDSSFITPFLLLYYKSKIMDLHQICVRAQKMHGMAIKNAVPSPLAEFLF